jgi:dipeptidyl-peptidase-4
MLDDQSIAVFPRIGTAVARNIQASRDGRYVAFLWSERGDEHLSLWVTELASGKRKCVLPAEMGYRSVDELPAEIELLRERMRQRYLGVLSYAWFPHVARLLVPRADDLIAVDADTGQYRVVASASGPIQLAKISPDGTKVAFACRNDLWLGEGLEEGTARLRQLTTGGTERLLNGAADFLAQEELSRYDAFWWHPQSNEIAFLQTNLNRVPIVGIPARRPPGTDLHSYSFAGSPIGGWQVGTVRCDDSSVSWLPIEEKMRDGYFARAQFDERGRLLAQVLNRKQDRLWLLECSPSPDARWSTLLEERSDYWVNVAGNVLLGPQEKSFVWLSTGGNENQIQVRDMGGNGCRTLATDDVRVDGIVGVVAERGTVWFHGRKGSPENRFVFRVPLDGKGRVEAISETAGWHDAKLLSGKGLWVYTYESLLAPPRLDVRNEKGEVVVELPSDPRACDAATQLPLPEFFDVPGEDGVALRACLYRPTNQSATSRWPLLVAVYGGPGVQSVRNTWDVRVDLRCQRFSAEGALVLKTDNRGSSGRGSAFERRIGGRFGTVDVEDQVRAVRYLVDERKIADGKRVAVSGWSYGGYLAASCLSSAADVFKAAVAGAPVVSWHDYDACYTERYMGNPESCREAYARADVSKYAGNLAGRLLIIHGLRDENVLFAHTARLVRALNESRVDYDLLILPEERHSVTSFENRVLVERRVFDHVMASFR